MKVEIESSKSVDTVIRYRISLKEYLWGERTCKYLLKSIDCIEDIEYHI